MKKTLSVFLAVIMVLGVIPFTGISLKADAGTQSTYVDGWHHYSGVALGGSRLTALGADEVTSAYNYQSNITTRTREMDASLAPTATYYTDVNEIKTLSDLTSKKGFKLNFRVTNLDYCTIMNYWIGTDNSAYTTSAQSQKYPSLSIGASYDEYLYGPAPSAGGQEINVLLTMWTDISQGGSEYIHAGTKLRLKFIGFDKSALKALTEEEERLSRSAALYTEDTFYAYSVALAGAQTVLASATPAQAQIDAALSALQNAVNALSPVNGLDLSGLYAAIDRANAVDRSLYVSLTELDRALANATNITAVRTQSDINDLITAIDAAITKLVLKNNQSAAVSTYVHLSHNWTGIAAGETKISVYGADEVSAPSATFAVNDSVQTRQMADAAAPVATFYTDVNKIHTLQDLTSQRGFKLNYSVISNTYANVMNYTLSSTRSGYSTSVSGQKDISGRGPGSNWDEYVYGAAPSTGGEVIDMYICSWTDMAQSSTFSGSTYIHAYAKLKLVFIGYDKTELENAINTDVLKKSLYTEDSYAAYLSALSSAVAVMNDGTPLQSEIDAATDALNAAIDALEAKLDYTDLFAARNEANALSPADYKDFSGVTEAVNKVDTADIKTQEDIDDLAADIRLAIRKLETKTSAASGFSTYVDGYQHYPGVSLGGGRLTAYGADEVTSPYTFTSEVTTMHRYMDASLAPVATYYTDVDLIKNMSDLASQKGFRLNFSVTNTLFCTIFNYAITSGNSAYSTSASSMQSASPSVGWNKDHTLSGAVPTTGGQEIVIPLTLESDISQGGSQYIVALQYLNLKLIGFDKKPLRACVDTPVLGKSFYTADSYASYVDALTAAVQVLNKPVTNQTELDAAKTALTAAINGLTLAYDITFIGPDGTVLAFYENIGAGSALTVPEIPAKDPDASCHYIGEWDSEIVPVNGNKTYTASYGSYTHTGGTATCTAQAVCPTCGTSYGALAPHSYTNYVSDGNATCLADGTKTAKCDNCSSTNTLPDPGSKKEHSYTGDFINNENGTHSYKCVNGCNEYGGMVNCTFGAWTTTTAPGCTTTGKKEHTCTVCGYKAEADIEAQGHSYGELITEVPATCMETGTKAHYTCSVCSKNFDADKNELESLVIPVDPTAHTGKNHTENYKDSTCTEAGYTGDTVCECGAKIADGEEIAMKAHAYGEWKVTLAATCMAKGTEKRTCADCPAYEERDIDIDPANHTNVTHTENAKAATCTEVGYTGDTVCECGVKLADGEEIALKAHAYGAWEITLAATCMAKGTEKRTCADCPAFETRETAVDPANHTNVTHTENEKTATCTEKGYTGDTVCECGVKLADGEEIALRAHAYGEWEVTLAATCMAKGTEKRTCADCPAFETRETAVDPANHTNVTHVENAKPATCTEKGYTGDTVCECGATLIEGAEIELENHAYGDWAVVTAATCMTKGLEKRTCADCPAYETRETDVDPDAHTGVNHTENAKASTCSVKGYTGDTVCECGAIIVSGEEIALKDHNITFKSITEPTCEDKGKTVYGCTECDYTYDVEHPANGHTAGATVIENVVSDGHTKEYDNVVYCTVCGEKLSENHVISDYECPACEMVDLAAQFNGNIFGKFILLAHDIFHAIFKLFDSVIGR